MKEKTKQRIKIEKAYEDYINKITIKVDKKFLTLPPSFNDEKIKERIRSNKKELNELIKKAKNIEKKLNLLKLKKMQRFTRLGINAEKFYDEAATKSTFLYYLTEKSFNSLNLKSFEIIINRGRDIVNLYNVIDVLELVHKNKTQIRFKKSDIDLKENDKLLFINNCFIVLSNIQREEELRKTLAHKNDVNTIKTRKKIWHYLFIF